MHLLIPCSCSSCTITTPIPLLALLLKFQQRGAPGRLISVWLGFPVSALWSRNVTEVDTGNGEEAEAWPMKKLPNSLWSDDIGEQKQKTKPLKILMWPWLA